MFSDTGRAATPRRNVPRVVVFAGIGALILVLVVLAIYLLSGSAPPNTEEVIDAFRDEGLEVGEVQPQDPNEESPLPKTFEEHTRFLIPSAGEDLGGRVFTFDSEEDLELIESYYEGLNTAGGLFCCSYLYREDLVLLQVPGEVPENQADRYGEVLSREF